MNLVNILRTWRDYPKHLKEKILERPKTDMWYRLACPTFIIAEALIAGKITYYMTGSKELGSVSSVLVAIERIKQGDSYDLF